MTIQIEKLRKLRESLGLNTTEISKVLGVRHTTWSAVERGDNALSSPMKQLLIVVFRVNPAWLDGTSENMFQIADKPRTEHLIADIISHYLYSNKISFRQASLDTSIEANKIVEMVNHRYASPDLIERFKKTYKDLDLELLSCDKCEARIKTLEEDNERLKKIVDKLMG